MKPLIRLTATGLLSLTTLVPHARTAPAQSPTALPKLDSDRFMTTWYEIERYPVKAEKRCLSDAMMLYAPGDKRNSLLLVTSCSIKNGNSDSWNAKGKLDGSGGGKLKINRIRPLHANYWVLATAPEYEWALLGSPNHRSLWVLSKATTLKPDVLAQIEAMAAAQRFTTTKLVKMPQHDSSPTPPVPTPSSPAQIAPSTSPM